MRNSANAQGPCRADPLVPGVRIVSPWRGLSWHRLKRRRAIQGMGSPCNLGCFPGLAGSLGSLPMTVHVRSQPEFRLKDWYLVSGHRGSLPLDYVLHACGPALNASTSRDPGIHCAPISFSIAGLISLLRAPYAGQIVRCRSPILCSVLSA